jgi:Fic family protein
MRSFTDLDATLAMVPGPVVTLLRSIDIGAGSEALYSNQLPALLAELAHRARGESITASSAIEGIVVPDAERARRIIQGRPLTLRTRNEQELAGYRKALDYLFTEDWAPVNLGLVLHLHRLLWSETPAEGGSLKNTDNLVVDRSPDGGIEVRFTPVSAEQTEFYLVELLERYALAQREARHHPVLLVGLFVLDLLIIHPFIDGNGRVARALTNALLADAGYGVGRWVSLEQLIAETPEEYYASLLASTGGWHEDDADVWPWLAFFVGVVARAYERFTHRAASSRATGSKQERVREYVLRHAAPIFRIADIRTALPGISDQTIRLALDTLKRDGAVTPDGTGRTATWRRLT